MPFKKDYLINYYNYLTQNGFTIVKAKESTFNYNFISLLAYKTNNPQCLKISGYSDFSFEKFLGLNDFKSFLSQNSFPYIYCIDNNQIHMEFLSNFYQNSSKDIKKIIIKNINTLLHSNISNDFFNFIDKISKNNNEIIQNIHYFPISVLSFNTLKLEDIYSYLIKKNIPKTDIDIFFVKFLKVRKNQIKDSINGPIVLKFLLDIYGRDENQLKHYFDFSNYVKSEFIPLELDFTEINFTNVITTRINCKKAAQLLCIPNYSEHIIKNEIINFVFYLKDIFNFENTITEDFNVSKNIIEVRCYTNNNFSQKELNETIKEFLLFKKEEPTIQTNKNLVESWFLKKKLNSQLTQKIEQNKIKIKI